MLKLVSKIEGEEKERKQLLAECKNDEERIKLRQKFFNEKTASQKKIKEVMSRHKKEVDYLEKMALQDEVKRKEELRNSGRSQRDGDKLAEGEEEHQGEAGAEEHGIEGGEQPEGQEEQPADQQ